MDDLMSKFITSATMLLTGFTVVFAVLVFLIFIIAIYGKVVSSAQNKGKKQKNTTQEVLAKSQAPQPIVPTVVSNTASDDNGISEEIVACISAAVDSMYGSKKVKIKNITKASGRNAWANAGVLDNTRPF